MVEINIAIAFISGLVIGFTPCILLMLSVFGASIFLTEQKNKFFLMSIGLLSGMILAYILMSIIFLFFVQLLDVFIYFHYIFGGLLIFIGSWEILESKKEKSIIFGTPEKVKLLLKDFIEKNSWFYAFIVGIIFVLIKIPCFGTVYLTLLYNIHTDPLLYIFIIVYLLGMVIPIILLLVLMRFGLESSKINEFRLKYRTHLRILSGALLIFLAIFLLINQILI